MSILRPGGGLYWDTRTYILNIPIHEFFNWRTVQTWTIPIIFVYYMGHRRTKNRKQYHLEPNHGEKFISFQNERIGKKAYQMKKKSQNNGFFIQISGFANFVHFGNWNHKCWFFTKALSNPKTTVEASNTKKLASNYIPNQVFFPWNCETRPKIDWKSSRIVLRNFKTKWCFHKFWGEMKTFLILNRI